MIITITMNTMITTIKNQRITLMTTVNCQDSNDCYDHNLLAPPNLLSPHTTLIPNGNLMQYYIFELSK